jgi:hypothetical protein
MLVEEIAGGHNYSFARPRSCCGMISHRMSASPRSLIF